jgi:hypothetical protein
LSESSWACCRALQSVNSYRLLQLARRRIGRGRLGFSPGAQIDRRHLHFLVPVDQQCGASIELVRDIEKMLGELVAVMLTNSARPTRRWTCARCSSGINE